MSATSPQRMAVTSVTTSFAWETTASCVELAPGYSCASASRRAATFVVFDWEGSVSLPAVLVLAPTAGQYIRPR